MKRKASRRKTAVSPLGLWAQFSRISMESQLVIGLRMAGMLGIVAQAPNEPIRMVAEKQAAATESFLAITTAATRGASPQQVMSAALKPYGKRTSANSRRLTRSS